MNEKLTGKILKAIARGELSRAEAAKLLECSERQVNRLMREHGVRRPKSDWRVQAEARARRRAVREAELLELAKRAAGGLEDRRVLAKAGGVSVRTLFRWIQRVKSE